MVDEYLGALLKGVLRTAGIRDAVIGDAVAVGCLRRRIEVRDSARVMIEPPAFISGDSALERATRE